MFHVCVVKVTYKGNMDLFYILKLLSLTPLISHICLVGCFSRVLILFKLLLFVYGYRYVITLFFTSRE